MTEIDRWGLYDFIDTAYSSDNITGAYPWDGK